MATFESREPKFMNAKVEIEAGVCGFATVAKATCNDSQHVEFDVKSGCEKVRKFAETLIAGGAVDAYQEISAKKESKVMEAAKKTLKGCCSACVAPCGVFKAMQVAAGLALPKDISMKICKEE
jgi:hypothetical protein